VGRLIILKGDGKDREGLEQVMDDWALILINLVLMGEFSGTKRAS